MRALLFMGLVLLTVACSSQITDFEECIEAGFPAMESYPRQCSDGTNTFVEKLDLWDDNGVMLMKHNVTGELGCFGCSDSLCIDPISEMKPIPESRDFYCNEDFEVVGTEPEQKPEVCTREYRPVCGEVQVQCIRAPCDPIKTTFSNECEAERAGAENIVEGACVDEEQNPKGACLSFDGNWLEGSQECEGMPEEMCEELGGTHNECASACRNNPDATVCTLQCVQVCNFS